MVVPFLEAALTYQRIESLSGKLLMTDELIRFFSKRTPDELEVLVRLTMGEVRPGYEGIEIGVAEKLVVKALYQVTMVPVDEIEKGRKTVGDIGLLTEEIMKRKMQMSLFSEPLTTERVFGNLEKMARVEGRSSQDLKLKMVAELLHDASPLEARYIVRIVCQKMRLGIADMTIIDALSYLFTPGFEKASLDLMSGSGLEKLHPLAERLPERSTSVLYSLMERLSIPKKEGIPPDEASRALAILEDLKGSIQKNREKIVRAYNIHPDIGYLAHLLSLSGMSAVESIMVTPFIPLRAMLGERLSSIGDIIEKMGGKAALEYKYDGLRVQAHIAREKDETKIRLYSRQLEDITEQFPDVVEFLRNGFQCSSAIVEGECVPIDPDSSSFMPFQMISRRRGRKHDLAENIDQVPVVLVLFDCLFLDGRDLTTEPYLTRRDSIGEAFGGIKEEIDPEKGLVLSKMEIVDEASKGEEFFLRALEDGCEGVMAKSVSDQSVYQAGSRGWLWIKYKRDYRSELSDTLDLVVVGAFHGSGRRKGTYGALLMAVLDDVSGEFHTLCKLGSGFNDEDLAVIKEIIDEERGERENVWKNVFSKMEVDVHVKPEKVLEVVGAEITFSPNHTCSFNRMREGYGLALRFPRFTGRYRDDKGPLEATTEREVESLYSLQNRVISEKLPERGEEPGNYHHQ